MIVQRYSPLQALGENKVSRYTRSLYGCARSLYGCARRLYGSVLKEMYKLHALQVALPCALALIHTKALWDFLLWLFFGRVLKSSAGRTTYIRYLEEFGPNGLLWPTELLIINFNGSAAYSLIFWPNIPSAKKTLCNKRNFWKTMHENVTRDIKSNKIIENNIFNSVVNREKQNSLSGFGIC